MYLIFFINNVFVHCILHTKNLNILYDYRLLTSSFTHVYNLTYSHYVIYL